MNNKFGIEQALLNKKVIKWLNCLTETQRYNIQIACAAHLDCPIIEIDLDYLDNDLLNWLYETFESSINEIK